MKIFETPVIEVTKFTVGDIMATLSGGSDTCTAYCASYNTCPNKGALPWG